MTITCRRCSRPLTRHQAVATREGTYCAKHADRLPPYLRRPTAQPTVADQQRRVTPTDKEPVS